MTEVTPLSTHMLKLSELSFQKRRPDYDAIANWLNDSDPNRMVMFVKGQPGSGKTRMLQHLIEIVGSVGWQTLDLTQYDYETIGPAIERNTAND